MVMKKILFMLLLSSCVLCGSAKSMRELWVGLPDSIAPYLSADQRQVMLNFIGMGLKGDASNSFGGKCVVDTLTDDYMHVTLSERSALTIKRLPAMQGDSVICLVHTWSAPDKESKAELYSQNWQLIGPAVDSSVDLRSQLLVRPDTMTQADFNRLLTQIDFSMVSYKLNANASTLVANIAIPTDEKSQKTAFQPVVRLTTLKWNGITFK